MIRLSPSSLVLLAAALVAAAPAVSACGDDESTAMPPAGVACSSAKDAADSDGARAALAGASAGTCVILTGASYVGPFDVPAGAALVAASGARATVTGGSAAVPAISAGARAQLAGIDVTGSPGVGVYVRGGGAIVTDVKVTGAKSAALAVSCEGACAEGDVKLSDVTLEKSMLGLWVSGASVKMKGGRSAEHGGGSLTGGFGVVAVSGAYVVLDGVTVEKNEGTGVLADGEKTRIEIKDSNVSENGERGIWVQRVSGTLEAPSLKLEGTTVSKNKIVGVGALESRGIIIVGGKVSDTVAAPTVTNLAQTEDVGDGIGLFGGSSDFKLDQTELSANARAAGVIDGSERGIIIVGGKVTAGASGLKVVVQNSTVTVQVPDGDLSRPAKALGISAQRVVIPPIGP